MYFLNKTAATIVMLTSSISFAGTMGSVCTNSNPTISCALDNKWDFSAQALYLQPTYTTYFHIASLTNAPGLTRWYDLSPDWGFGFKLEGAYHFKAGYDATLNWYHYNKTTNHTLTINKIATGRTASAFPMDTRLNPTWDAVNGEVGQFVQFGELQTIRFHGGLHYVQMSQNYNDYVSGFAPEQVYMKLSGVGPRIGADITYKCGHGFAIRIGGATAMLAGTGSFSTVTSGVLDIPGSSEASVEVIVPEVEGKVGADYTYTMRQGQSSLTLNAGYMWLNYIHAYSFLTTNGVGSGTDFAIQGPYVGLKWLG